MKDNPCYPDLSEEAENEAQVLMDKFSVEIEKKISDVVQKTKSEFYYDIVHFVKGDSWTNFRQSILNAL